MTALTRIPSSRYFTGGDVVLSGGLAAACAAAA